MINPCKCKNCSERCDGCHSRCESYKAFRAELDEINKQIRQKKEISEFDFAVSKRLRVEKLKDKKRYRND